MPQDGLCADPDPLPPDSCPSKVDGGTQEDIEKFVIMKRDSWEQLRDKFGFMDGHEVPDNREICQECRQKRIADEQSRSSPLDYVEIKVPVKNMGHATTSQIVGDEQGQP